MFTPHRPAVHAAASRTARRAPSPACGRCLAAPARAGAQPHPPWPLDSWPGQCESSRAAVTPARTARRKPPVSSACVARCGEIAGRRALRENPRPGLRTTVSCTSALDATARRRSRFHDSHRCCRRWRCPRVPPPPPPPRRPGLGRHHWGARCAARHEHQLKRDIVQQHAQIAGRAVAAAGGGGGGVSDALHGRLCRRHHGFPALRPRSSPHICLRAHLHLRLPRRLCQSLLQPMPRADSMHAAAARPGAEQRSAPALLLGAAPRSVIACVCRRVPHIRRARVRPQLPQLAHVTREHRGPRWRQRAAE